MKFYLINKDNQKSLLHFSTAHHIAVYLLGRRLSNYIIVKEKDDGTVSAFNKFSHDIREIEKMLEEL